MIVNILDALLYSQAEMHMHPFYFILNIASNNFEKDQNINSAGCSNGTMPPSRLVVQLKNDACYRKSEKCSKSECAVT